MSKMAAWREDKWDIAEDAAINFMTKIRDGVKVGPGVMGKNSKVREFWPKSLPTMLRFEIMNLLYTNKKKWEDSIISLDEYLENKQIEENYEDKF